MKNIFLTYAKYNKDADQTAVSLLNALSHEEREKERGSYYKSLSGLSRHLLQGTIYLQGLCKSGLSHNPQAMKAFAPLEGISIPQDALTEAQWKALVPVFEIVDNSVILLVSALNDADFTVSIKIPWYQGNPDAVPLSFLLQSLMVHGTHHRGQISQILDELKIDHNYSSIKADFIG
ncbi:MAG: damage-inducible protein DinB [Treponema sp.]|jgi:uncharacterized damage-inducible protein DinB|nr:damage-inducible protein DinB [Treponema sp.]